MIEPIGSGENQLSPHERFIQYQQYRNNAGAARGSLWDAAAAQGRSMPPGQEASLGKTVPPGQAVLQAQGAQEPEAFQNDLIRKPAAADKTAAVGKRECQTCKNRRYQDESADPGVSYQTPTKISPDRAAAAVRAHENEHVGREQAKAKRQGREVVSQSVVIKTAICPECGRVYISGGTTTTVTRAKSKDNAFQAGQPSDTDGAYLDRNI